MLPVGTRASLISKQWTTDVFIESSQRFSPWSQRQKVFWATDGQQGADFGPLNRAIASLAWQGDVEGYLNERGKPYAAKSVASMLRG